MIKRVFVVALVAFAVGQLLVTGVRYAQNGAWFGSSEADRRSRQFEQMLRLVRENYVDGDAATFEKLARTAMESVPRSLDPHSEFLWGDEFENFRADTSQEFGGIGVQIEMRDRKLTVVAPIGGTPGERAGMLRGDQVIEVDGTKLEGQSLDDCLKLMRGKPGSTVKLSIFRPRTGETLQKSIVREIITVESVREARMLNPEIGYVRILQFGERTGREFVEALESLEAEGMRGLVLDLRDNPGGLLDVAVEVAQIFFERGELVVFTQGRDPESREDIVARPRDPPRTYPVAVLINSGSASASEIVAGALRDTNRAVLVGEKSFGKGSVQTVFPLRGTSDAIRLTTAYYYLPSGNIINGKGIEPHIPVTLTAEEDRKLVVQRSRLPLMTAEEFTEQFEFDPIEDRQLSAAVDALRGVFAVGTLRQ